MFDNYRAAGFPNLQLLDVASPGCIELDLYGW